MKHKNCSRHALFPLINNTDYWYWNYYRDMSSEAENNKVSFNDEDSADEESMIRAPEDDEDEESGEDESGDELSDVSDDDAWVQYSTLNCYDEDQLPDYACRYCGIHDPACVARCVETNKWFCNDATAGSTSHLIHHLVKSRSRQVQLHQESPLGDSLLECYNCSSPNVFVLGFVPASTSSVVVLLCRVCVETVPALKDMEWELSQWHPVIQDRKFLSWLIKSPHENLVLRARQVNGSQMIKMEEMWKTNPNARYSQLDAPEEEEEVAIQVEKKYEDGYHYQNILAPLVKMEADYDREMKESLSEESLRVRWDKSLTGKWIAFFTFRRIQVEVTKIVVGDELRLKLGQGGEFLYGKPWEGVGYVKSILDSEVELELRTAGSVPENLSEDYIVEYIWKSTSFDRMQNALKVFAVDDKSVTGYIYHKLLGHDVQDVRINGVKIPQKEEDFQAPGLPALNESQIKAVTSVLRSPFSLIQGPPGTGKTVTSATLVYHLAKQDLGQILVTAPSNVAVDHLTERIAATGLKVVRVASKTREATSSSVDHLCLHMMVPQAAGKDFLKLQQLKDEVGELSARDQKRYRSLQNKTERELLKDADVICCTCVGAGDPRLKNFGFRQVLIDEATQAIEAEALIPLVMGAKQAVLVGDHCQLGPVVMCKTAAKAGLTQSMFERLVVNGIRPLRLEIQYRMHPSISEFPSNMFYEGSLHNGITEADRQLLTLPEFQGKEDFPWPSPSHPLMFYSISGMEEISASGTSYLNRTEASYVEKCVTYLLRIGVTPAQIGVITPYDGQRKYVTDHMRRAGTLASKLYESIEVASVDAFQGREKDFILVSCVRSSESQGIGFLSDPRRLNVALTRARLGLILFGNPRVLCKNPLWAALLLHFKERETLVEGPLNNLKECFITISRPKRNIQSDSRYAFTALARGAWDGRWEDRRDGRSQHIHGKDSRYDKRYKNSHQDNGSGQGVPIPSFAPLPTYADDLSSVGGESEFGGSRASFYSQRKDTSSVSPGIYVGPGSVDIRNR